MTIQHRGRNEAHRTANICARTAHQLYQAGMPVSARAHWAAAVYWFERAEQQRTGGEGMSFGNYYPLGPDGERYYLAEEVDREGVTKSGQDLEKASLAALQGMMADSEVDGEAKDIAKAVFAVAEAWLAEAEKRRGNNA